MACLAMAALVACSRQGTSASAGQVVARINGHEVTVSQLNRELSNASVTSGDPNQLRQAALDRLITNELIAQAAAAEKIDREPGVQAQIDESRRRVLARAFARQKVFPEDQIDDSQLRDFYHNHPLLFEKRRIYQGVLFSIDDAVKVPQSVSARLARAHSEAEVAAVLKSEGLQSRQESLNAAAESLSLEWLPALASSKPGDVVPLTTSDGHLRVLLVTAVDDAPRTFGDAKAGIASYLEVKRNEEALKSYIATQRASAMIEYGAGYDTPMQN